jgi:hypothetical protein
MNHYKVLVTMVTLVRAMITVKADNALLRLPSVQKYATMVSITMEMRASIAAIRIACPHRHAALVEPLR